MAYNEQMADRVRLALSHIEDVEEKAMFGGLCFMVNNKMCICVNEEEMLYRVGPDFEEEALEQPGARPMDFTGRPMKGYVFVDLDYVRKKSELDYWVKQCLAYNPLAKASKKKK